MLMFEDGGGGGAIQGTNVDAAGRLQAQQTPAHNTTQSLRLVLVLLRLLLLRVAWQSLK